ncbi:flagellin-like protein [Halarchaeum solikamskense]|uniref:type IV pilin n=1 Tax=Halarchaeum nitratireducens TaxID=489913 RepID=UPI001B3ABA4B|nr:type IV pilin N-terminal domain-containing protein [Halarchaeum solikamskense]MBP2250445.1 flagellin-like protein [Halarchaeum solikamskense]
MDLKQLLSDDRGVSPVIGVILMVAITVILAAVIGTFVLGLGSNVGNNAPSATFDYDYSGTFNDSNNNAAVAITHQGGDAIEHDTIHVNIGSDRINTSTDNAGSGYTFATNDWNTSQITAGDRVNISTDGSGIPANEDVQVVWQSSGGSSSIISSSTTPNN